MGSFLKASSVEKRMPVSSSFAAKRLAAPLAETDMITTVLTWSFGRVR